MAGGDGRGSLTERGPREKFSLEELIEETAELVAQQANRAYMRQLADKAPELWQLACEMWMDQGDRLRSDLQMYDPLDSADAARWGSTVLDPFQQWTTAGNGGGFTGLGLDGTNALRELALEMESQ